MAQFTWEGDFAAAVEWLPFGESMVFKLKRMASGNIMRMNHQPTQDVLIMAQCNPDMVFVSAGSSGYLETGFANLGWFMAGNELTYKPATVYLTPHILRRMTQKPVPLINASQSRTLKTGDESWAMGCKDKIQTVVYDNGLTTETFTSSADAPLYCDVDTIAAKKLASVEFPASRFTGMMRVYVQALYGTQRTDYGSLGSIYGIYINPDEREASAAYARGETPYRISIEPNSTGLMQLDDGSYVMIQIGWTSDGGIYARKMIGTDSPAMRPELVNVEGIEGRKIKDAYKLATLTPSLDVVRIGTMPRRYYSNYWTPIAYGWHFNYSGTEVCITYTSDERGDGFYMSETVRGNISVSKDINGNLAGSVNFTVVNTGLFKLPYSIWVYSPNYLLQDRMDLRLFTPWSDNRVLAGNVGGPIYSYYDDDEFKEVVIKLNQTVELPRFQDARYLSDYYQTVFPWLGSYFETDSYYTEGWIDQQGGYYNSGEVTGPITGSFHLDYRGHAQYAVVSVGIAGSQDGYIQIAGTDGSQDDYIFGTKYFFGFPGTATTYRRVFTFVNYYENASLAIIIPFNDSQAVAVSRYTRPGWDSYFVTTETAGNYTLCKDTVNGYAFCGGAYFGFEAPPTGAIFSEGNEATLSRDIGIKVVGGSASAEFSSPDACEDYCFPSFLATMPWSNNITKVTRSAVNDSAYISVSTDVAKVNGWPAAVDTISTTMGWA